MSLAKLIFSGLVYHWRINLSVALAVMASAAVLTGALVVGDSMRGSLRHLLLDQLGRIDDVLVTDHFFRPQLAEEVIHGPEFKKNFDAAVPGILVQGSLENPRPEGSLRAGQVTVIGTGAEFWKLGTGGPEHAPGKGDIVLNAPLATELGAKAGDELLLRIGSVSQIPPDSALGRKTETVRNRRLKVSAVIPAEGLGRFALFPSQLVPNTAFVATETLQAALEQPGKVNAIFVAGRAGSEPSLAADDALQASLHPTAADFGITLEHHKLGYWQYTSNRMLLEPPAVAAIERAVADDHPQAIFTYLANTIAGRGQEIPYSTITAMDFRAEPPLGPFLSPDGKPISPLADDEIALNTWAAEDLGVQIGDEITITFFEPESTHGAVRERTAKFRLAAVVALEALAADRDLTPQLPGVTDRLTIGDWDAPFPFDSSRVRKKDEAYWNDHRTTPKAFISLAAGRKLWSSRFGDTTAIRFALAPGQTEPTIALNPADFGFRFLPLKRLGLQAAGGTTPFDALFIGFSLFIMIAALMLVALLFRLGIEQRAESIGIMRTVGLPARKVATVLAAEGLIVTILGSLAGIVAGVAYARLMLAGLTTWWLDAISTPFLRLYVTPRSLLIGFASGVIVSLLTILWTLRRLRSVSPRRLLARQTVEDRWLSRGEGRKSRVVAVVMLTLAVILAVVGVTGRSLGSEAQAGAFVGSGSLVLAAALLLVWNRLAGSAGNPVRQGFSIGRLAVRSGARNPGRSTLSIGLIAAASFLIVALSAFRLDPESEGHGKNSGSGGFDLVAQSDQPIYPDLNSTKGRTDLGFSDVANDLLKSTNIVPLRVRAGDDASCLNLYQPTEPRVLGVTERLIERGGFAWAASAAENDDERANPWRLLDRTLPDAPDGVRVVPAVLDFNTAMYSLHKGAIGDTIEMRDGRGRDVRFQIVGLLKNSILQGDMLIGERDFLQLFPQVSGYRLFLIDSGGESIIDPDARAREVRSALEGPLGDFGFDAQNSQDRLAGFFAVQNTYLSTFQSLGGLGLLLGTFGLATVQLRSVLERRGELALMRASGFRRALLARLVMLENTMLLVGGLVIGVAAALVAVLPHWLGGGAEVPWRSLILTLATVLFVGLLAGLVAVRATLRAPLLPALREE